MRLGRDFGARRDVLGYPGSEFLGLARHGLEPEIARLQDAMGPGVQASPATAFNAQRLLIPGATLETSHSVS